jgi:hypothetical protein
MASDANGIEYHAEPTESFYQYQARNLRYWRTLDDYDLQMRDSDWIARELGDVPHDRIAGLTCHDNPLSWSAPSDTPYLGIPVESLGRDL